MASSGTSSGGSTAAAADQRKRKRMLSNRESARRSRQRKQKHLDDLTAQASQLRKENAQIVTALNVTTQHYLGVEAENSVLRTQMMELTQRLQSLNEILNCMNAASSEASAELFCDDEDDGLMMMRQQQLLQLQPWSLMEVGNLQLLQPASVDMYHY